MGGGKKKPSEGLVSQPVLVGIKAALISAEDILIEVRWTRKGEHHLHAD